MYLHHYVCNVVPILYLPIHQVLLERAAKVMLIAPGLLHVLVNRLDAQVVHCPYYQYLNHFISLFLLPNHTTLSSHHITLHLFNPLLIPTLTYIGACFDQPHPNLR